MKKILRVILIILVIVAIVGFAVFVFNYNNQKQMQVLTSEINSVLQQDLTSDEIDTTIKTKGEFGKIESAIKTYLTDSQKIYKDLVAEYDELNADNLLSGNDINVKKLKDIQESLSAYSQKAKNLSDENKEQNTTDKKESYRESINGIGASYYKNIYSSLINSDSVKDELNSLSNKSDKEYQNITTRIYNIDKVINFLIDNQKSWKLENGKIKFTNANLLTQYYEILNNDIEE